MTDILNYCQRCFSTIVLIFLAFPVCQVSARTKEVFGTQTRKLQQRQIPIATTIEGTIMTPIIWTDSSQSSTTKATIILNEPLFYSDGIIALPVGSSIVVEVANFDRAGFVTLNAIAVTYVDRQGKFNQYSIPEGSLLIRDKDNRPLKFETELNNRRSIVTDFMGEAVQTGARKLPLPSGLDSAISRTIRNNSTPSRRSASDAIYSIEEKTEVSIYVNSFLNIEN